MSQSWVDTKRTSDPVLSPMSISRDGRTLGLDGRSQEPCLDAHSEIQPLIMSTTSGALISGTTFLYAMCLASGSAVCVRKSRVGRNPLLTYTERF